MANIKFNLKKFIVVPRDALELMTQRFGEIEEANGAAELSCTDGGQTTYVLEMRTVVARADRPVKVTKL